MVCGLLAAGAVPLTANAFAMAALLTARISLGRWPDRGGMDDPGHVPWVDPVSYPAYLLVLMTIPAGIVMSVISLILLARSDSPRKPLIARREMPVMIALALWLMGVALTRTDPAEVWQWLWD